MAGKRKNAATAIWQGGLAFEAAAEGPAVLMDSPMAPDGPKGPSPMQLLLISLAGCTGMDVINILQKKRQDVTWFEVSVVGQRAYEHPRYYTGIEIEFVVRGRGVDPRALERAIELSQDKYCSVSAGLKPKAAIVTRFRVEEEAAGSEE
jgi:putative redox protein